MLPPLLRELILAHKHARSSLVHPWKSLTKSDWLSLGRSRTPIVSSSWLRPLSSADGGALNKGPPLCRAKHQWTNHQSDTHPSPRSAHIFSTHRPGHQASTDQKSTLPEHGPGGEARPFFSRFSLLEIIFAHCPYDGHEPNQPLCSGQTNSICDSELPVGPRRGWRVARVSSHLRFRIGLLYGSSRDSVWKKSSVLTSCFWLPRVPREPASSSSMSLPTTD